MNDLNDLIIQAKKTHAAQAIKQLAIDCLDYTSLNETDTEDDIRTLLQTAITPLGHVAAICIYPEFVDFAKRERQEKAVNIATVANFPDGDGSLNDVIFAVKTSLFDGADEIDIVLPYKAYLAGNKTDAINLIETAKSICGDKTLKVILETGALKDLSIIAAASHDCLTAGADFLKTSTGKIATGATLEAAAIMLQTIKTYRQTHQRTVGFKASGGVRTAKEAAQYIALATKIMGSGWVSRETFRIGASSLLIDLLK